MSPSSPHGLRAKCRALARDLAAARRALRRAESRWRSDADRRAEGSRLKEAESIAHIGSFERDVRGRWVSWSDELYRIFGIRPGAPLRPDSLMRRVHPQDRAIPRAAMARALANEGWFEYDIRILDSRRLLRHLHTRGRVLSDAEGRPSKVVGTVQDVSDRVHYLETLKETWVLLKTLIRSSPLAIMACDNAGRVTVWNLAAQRLFGWSEEAVLGMFPPALLGGVGSGAASLLREAIASGDAGERVVRCLRADGSAVEVDLWASRLEDEKGRAMGLLGMFLDVTERQRLEREVAEISESERRRIGRDLHDGLGQSLSGIGLSAKALQKKLALREPALAAEAEGLSRAVSAAVASARDLSHLLFPEELERGGLGPALRNLADNAARTAGIPCSYRDSGDTGEPDKEIRIQLFRIAQEAVHNALKHARARKVRLGLSSLRGRIVLRVFDDGRGIGRGAGKKRGIGLRLMEHRAGLIGARLAIDSTPGKGTLILCESPLRVPARGAR